MGQTLSSESGKNTVCTLIKSLLRHSGTCWYLLIFSVCCTLPVDAFKRSIKKVNYFPLVKSNKSYHFLINCDKYFSSIKNEKHNWVY